MRSFSRVFRNSKDTFMLMVITDTEAKQLEVRLLKADDSEAEVVGLHYWTDQPGRYAAEAAASVHAAAGSKRKIDGPWPMEYSINGQTTCAEDPA